MHSPKTAPTLSQGRYLIAGVLGRGGNAGVYQGWDNHLRRWRAIKVLSHEFIKDDHVRARFAQEAATMARLDHPNLVKVYDISDDPFTPHIVMELCAGGSIIDWMKVHGAVPPREACHVIISTAKAVAVAHLEDIVHRDIKPQNILIDHHSVIKLTDFGIARDERNSLTMAGQTMGTYAFMAPEQRHDSTTVDHRTDIYSLGATLFTLVAVKTTTELFVAEREDEILAGLPDPIVDFILKACQYKPSNRFQSIAEAVAALEAAKAALPADPEHPPLHALATPLPAEPPTDLPDLDQLEDLLKSLALNDDTPTYTGSTAPAGLDATTLGGSTPEPDPTVLPYYMPSNPGLTPAPAVRALKERLEETEVVPSYIDPLDFTSDPAPDRRFAELEHEPTNEEVVEEQKPLKLWMVAVGVVGFFLLLFTAAIGIGVNDVSNARTRVTRAELALVGAAASTSPVIQAVAEKGGDAEALRVAYFAMNDAAPDTRGATALEYASRLTAAADILALPPGAQTLVKTVEKEQKSLENARRDLEAAVASPLGALAVMLRVTDGGS